MDSNSKPILGRFTLDQAAELCDWLSGTANSPAAATEHFDWLEDSDISDIEEIAISANNPVEVCRGCDWWFDSSELTPDPDTEGDDENLVGLCEDCRKEETADPE